jgi:hypothetical protein
MTPTMTRTVSWERVICLCVMFLVCGGCQDVQPSSTLDASIEKTGMSPGSPADTEGETELEVRLEEIDRARPQVALQPRNPFRFGGSTAIVPSILDVAEPPGIGELPPTFPSVADVAPRVRLRMIGLVDTPDTDGRIAVLTDGDVVFHGRAGEIVEGRYRILSVGPLSMEIETVDDGRRQVLRLTGS